MVTQAIAFLMATGIALSGVGLDDLGEVRVTNYCPSCNTGGGHTSSSGVYLEEGHAACRWLPNGTLIVVDGQVFEIVDTCGTDAIDIFIESDRCRCDLNEYKRVYVMRGAGE